MCGAGSCGWLLAPVFCCSVQLLLLKGAAPSLGTGDLQLLSPSPVFPLSLYIPSPLFPFFFFPVSPFSPQHLLFIPSCPSPASPLISPLFQLLMLNGIEQWFHHDLIRLAPVPW